MSYKCVFNHRNIYVLLHKSPGLENLNMKSKAQRAQNKQYWVAMGLYNLSKKKRNNAFSLFLYKSLWVQNCPFHLCLQDGSSLLFSCEGLLQNFNMLLAVRELICEGLQLCLQGQQLSIFAWQLLFHLTNLKKKEKMGEGK